MLGIVRPCRHTLGPDLGREWSAHLCGLCLALRDRFGQAARLATNYDGLLLTVLVAAQKPAGLGLRTAGPCPARGLRTAPVVRADSAAATLAAAVSLVLAGTKAADHVADGDTARPLRPLARRVGDRWIRAGARALAETGVDPEPFVTVTARQARVEAAAGPGDLADVTRPTEDAVAAAFAHTAVLAGVPGNAPVLARMGASFGRLAHLVDAVEDRADDRRHGRWNPLEATATDDGEARRQVQAAQQDLRTGLADLTLARPELVTLLLDAETHRAVHRAFPRPRTPRLAEGLPPGVPPGVPVSSGVPWGPDSLATPSDPRRRWFYRPCGINNGTCCDWCTCCDCCGDGCCGDGCCGDSCCGDSCCGDSCCGDSCCGDSCCGDGCCDCG